MGVDVLSVLAGISHHDHHQRARVVVERVLRTIPKVGVALVEAREVSGIPGNRGVYLVKNGIEIGLHLAAADLLIGHFYRRVSKTHTGIRFGIDWQSS